MWLDRLGAHNIPQQPSNYNSRPISPLPRRVSSRGSPYTTSQQRSARASDVSLVSSSDNGSTTSLLRGSGRTNGVPSAGSSLRQTTTVDDGTESLFVLGRILGEHVPIHTETPGGSGTASPSESETARGTTIREEDLDLEFDFGGLSLREFVAQGDTESAGAGRVYRSQTVEECMWFCPLDNLLPSRSLRTGGGPMLTGCWIHVQTSRKLRNIKNYTGPYAHATTCSAPSRRALPASGVTWQLCLRT